MATSKAGWALSVPLCHPWGLVGKGHPCGGRQAALRSLVGKLLLPPALPEWFTEFWLLRQFSLPVPPDLVR